MDVVKLTEPDRELTFIEKIKQSNVSLFHVLLVACNLAFPLFLGQNISLISYDFNIQNYFVDTHCFFSPRVPAINWAITNAGFTVFGMIGSFAMSWAVDRYGRKYSSMFCICIGIIGELFLIGSFYSGRLELLGIHRALVGFSSAGGMVTALCFLFELLPLCFKVIFNPLVQVSINSGILISGIMTLDSVTGLDWQYIVIPPLVVSCLYLIVLIFMPESPVYLIKKNEEDLAIQSLKRLRKTHGQEIEREIQEIKEASQRVGASNLTVKDIFLSSELVVPMIVCVFIHVSQQISGINSVFAYVGTFFVDIDFNQPDVVTVIIFVVALFGSIIFFPLVAKVKRKVLLIIGHAGMCIAFLIGYITWLLDVTPIVRVVSLCFYVFIFQLGPGLLVWIITFEIFPQNATGAAQGLCTGANWIANTLIYILYPIIDGVIGFHVAAIFIGINFLICLFMIFAVVETHKKTPEEVIEKYKRKFRF